MIVRFIKAILPLLVSYITLELELNILENILIVLYSLASACCFVLAVGVEKDQRQTVREAFKSKFSPLWSSIAIAVCLSNLSLIYLYGAGTLFQVYLLSVLGIIALLISLLATEKGD